MEKLSHFYSELSNEDRLRILYLTSEEKLNLTQIAHKLGSSIQETSRNLSRLRKDKFVRKSPKGYYRITSYGRANMQVAASHKYFCENQDYFAKHNVSSIPQELICRIAEMEQSIRLDKVMKVIEQIEQCIEKSERQIHLMYDQVISTSLSTIEKKVKSGVNLVQIFPKTILLSADIRIISNGMGWDRTLNQVKNFVLVTEKEALVAHSGIYERIDYNMAFLTQGETARKWCFDLFNFFWEKAEPYRKLDSNDPKVDCKNKLSISFL
jgi:predicted transcriptional regulator